MVVLDEAKGKISLIAGILIAALGAIPLLNHFSVIGFNLPEFILKLIPAIAIFLIPAAGFFLFINSFSEESVVRAITLIVALLLVALGVIQLLNNFGVIGFGLPISDFIYQIVFVVEGLFLIGATFMMD